MAKRSLARVFFGNGEIDPRLLGRIDRPRYQASLALCENFFPTPFGGLRYRDGLRLRRVLTSQRHPARVKMVRARGYVGANERILILDGTMDQGKIEAYSFPYAGNTRFTLTDHWTRSTNRPTYTPGFNPGERNNIPPTIHEARVSYGDYAGTMLCHQDWAPLHIGSSVITDQARTDATVFITLAIDATSQNLWQISILTPDRSENLGRMPSTFSQAAGMTVDVRDVLAISGTPGSNSLWLVNRSSAILSELIGVLRDADGEPIEAAVTAFAAVPDDDDATRNILYCTTTANALFRIDRGTLRCEEIGTINASSGETVHGLTWHDSRLIAIDTGGQFIAVDRSAPGSSTHLGTIQTEISTPNPPNQPFVDTFTPPKTIASYRGFILAIMDVDSFRTDALVTVEDLSNGQIDVAGYVPEDLVDAQAMATIVVTVGPLDRLGQLFDEQVERTPNATTTAQTPVTPEREPVPTRLPEPLTAGVPDRVETIVDNLNPDVGDEVTISARFNAVVPTSNVAGVPVVVDEDPGRSTIKFANSDDASQKRFVRISGGTSGTASRGTQQITMLTYRVGQNVVAGDVAALRVSARFPGVDIQYSQSVYIRVGGTGSTPDPTPTTAGATYFTPKNYVDQLGNWQGEGAHPRCAAVFLDRMIMAGSRYLPGTFIGSELYPRPASELTGVDADASNAIFDGTLGPAVAIYNFYWLYHHPRKTDPREWRPVLPNDSFSYKIATERELEIVWMVPYNQYLVFGTSQGVWIGRNFDPHTPPEIVQYSNIPVGDVDPVVTDFGIAYADAGLQEVHVANLGVGFEPPDRRNLMTDARHLTAGTSIRQLAWQATPQRRLLMLTHHGTLAALCFEPDSDVLGWFRITNERLLFAGICVIPTESYEVPCVLAYARGAEGLTTLYLTTLDAPDHRDLGTGLHGDFTTDAIVPPADPALGGVVPTGTFGGPGEPPPPVNPEPPPPPVQPELGPDQLTISVNRYPAEGDGSATITATLNADAPTGGTRVTFRFSGSATPNTDYRPSATAITIAAGRRTGTITIQVIDDNVEQEGTEQIIVNASSTNPELTSNRLIIPIADNDLGTSPVDPVVTLSVSISGGSWVWYDRTLTLRANVSTNYRGSARITYRWSARLGNGSISGSGSSVVYTPSSVRTIDRTERIRLIVEITGVATASDEHPIDILGFGNIFITGPTSVIVGRSIVLTANGVLSTSGRRTSLSWAITNGRNTAAGRRLSASSGSTTRFYAGTLTGGSTITLVGRRAGREVGRDTHDVSIQPDTPPPVVRTLTVSEISGSATLRTIPFVNISTGRYSITASREGAGTIRYSWSVRSLDLHRQVTLQGRTDLSMCEVLAAGIAIGRSSYRFVLSCRVSSSGLTSVTKTKTVTVTM